MTSGHGDMFSAMYRSAHRKESGIFLYVKPKKNFFGEKQNFRGIELLVNFMS